MSLTTKLSRQNATLTAADEGYINRQFAALGRRVQKFPEPLVELTVAEHGGPRQFEVDLRLQLEPHGRHLISHQTAEVLTQAVKLAIQDVKRQLQRQFAKQSGEPSFGVPSRRPAPRCPPGFARLRTEPDV